MSYYYQAGVDGGLSPRAYSSISASKNVGSSNLATQAQLYNGAGFLLASSGWNYGNGSSANASVGVSQAGTGYIGKGYSLTKYGGTNYLYNSPTAVVYSYEPYSVNERNMTYGSLAWCTSPKDAPDLVAVISDDGTEGYAYYEDVFTGGYSGESFAVYDDDGATIVGRFTVGDRNMLSAGTF